MLVDLETAKRELRRDDDDDDERVVDKIRKASATVLDYMKIAQDSYSGTDGNLSDVPEVVQQATLVVLQNMYDQPNEDPISPAVVSLLMRMRDPAIA